jgi:hypothetical protein
VDWVGGCGARLGTRRRFFTALGSTERAGDFGSDAGGSRRFIDGRGVLSGALGVVNTPFINRSNSFWYGPGVASRCLGSWPAADEWLGVVVTSQASHALPTTTGVDADAVMLVDLRSLTDSLFGLFRVAGVGVDSSVLDRWTLGKVFEGRCASATNSDAVLHRKLGSKHSYHHQQDNYRLN